MFTFESLIKSFYINITYYKVSLGCQMEFIFSQKAPLILIIIIMIRKKLISFWKYWSRVKTCMYSECNESILVLFPQNGYITWPV